ncbi:MAG TPA: sel1 repeat family protein [Pseudidiomarina sp.]|nr:sel1 repeat family protein [Pseudidiomarina sp.]
MRLSISAMLIAAALSATPVFETHASSTNHIEVCPSGDCQSEMRRLAKLARNGSGDAAAVVAMAYASGDGVEKDLEQAYEFARHGVRYRSALAMYLLSDWYRTGTVVEQDMREANDLLDEAVALDYAPAQYKKAVLLLESGNDVAINEALTLIEAAAEQNLVNAMFALARLKHTGTVVEQDLVGAGDLYSRLTIAGFSPAKQYLRDVSREIDSESIEVDERLRARMSAAENVERIQVTADASLYQTQIQGLVERLETSGMYDSRSIGSRIRGKSCENSGSPCAVTRPDGRASSLNELLSGGN